ncbi:MAG TPA: glycosyltransferase [Nitrolancea sp.]|nr:glycosyltransferase [Nitrolancea sp.]
MQTILYPVNQLRIGGAEQQLLELVRRIDKTRFQAIVAPLYPGGPLDPEFHALPGVEVVELNRRGKADPSPLWRLASLMRRRRVDIVQPFLSPATFFGLLPALAVRTPVMVVTERCGVRKERGIGYKTYRTVEDWLSRAADALVPNSQAGATMLLERGLPAAKIRVIYNGINLERLEANSAAVAEHRAGLGVPAGGAVAGILASLTQPKGHDVLLRAVAELAHRQPGLRLAVIGDGPLRAALESQAAELGIADRVTFFGYQRRVADYLAACDLLVSASRDNEGCSNAILEAMALGVPVIATDIGGNRELVGHRETGYLVPVGDAPALADTIDGLLQYPLEAQRIVSAARAMVHQRFSLERMVADYEALYTRLLSHDRVPVRQVANEAGSLEQSVSAAEG